MPALLGFPALHLGPRDAARFLSAHKTLQKFECSLKMIWMPICNFRLRDSR